MGQPAQVGDVVTGVDGVAHLDQLHAAHVVADGVLDRDDRLPGDRLGVGLERDLGGGAARDVVEHHRARRWPRRRCGSGGARRPGRACCSTASPAAARRRRSSPPAAPARRSGRSSWCRRRRPRSARSPTASLTAARIWPSSATVVVGDSPVVPDTTTPSLPLSTRWRAIAAVPSRSTEPSSANAVAIAVRTRPNGVAGAVVMGFRLSLRPAEAAQPPPSGGGRGRAGRASAGRAGSARTRRSAPILSSTSSTVPPGGWRGGRRPRPGRSPWRAWATSASSAPTQSTSALEKIRLAGSRPIASQASPDAVVLLERPARRATNGRLNSSAYVAASAGVRRVALAADQHRRLGLDRLRQPGAVGHLVVLRRRRRSRPRSPTGR